MFIKILFISLIYSTNLSYAMNSEQIIIRIDTADTLQTTLEKLNTDPKLGQKINQFYYNDTLIPMETNDQLVKIMRKLSNLKTFVVHSERYYPSAAFLTALRPLPLKNLEINKICLDLDLKHIGLLNKTLRALSKTLESLSIQTHHPKDYHAFHTMDYRAFQKFITGGLSRLTHLKSLEISGFQLYSSQSATFNKALENLNELEQLSLQDASLHAGTLKALAATLIKLEKLTQVDLTQNPNIDFTKNPSGAFLLSELLPNTHLTNFQFNTDLFKSREEFMEFTKNLQETSVRTLQERRTHHSSLPITKHDRLPPSETTISQEELVKYIEDCEARGQKKLKALTTQKTFILNGLKPKYIAKIPSVLPQLERIEIHQLPTTSIHAFHAALEKLKKFQELSLLNNETLSDLEINTLLEEFIKRSPRVLKALDLQGQYLHSAIPLEKLIALHTINLNEIVTLDEDVLLEKLKQLPSLERLHFHGHFFSNQKEIQEQLEIILNY